jgi:hypothetical protein
MASSTAELDPVYANALRDSCSRSRTAVLLCRHGIAIGDVGVTGNIALLGRVSNWRRQPSDHAGPVDQVLGVYSGRIGAKDELQAQLGIVWRAEVVEQIVADGRPGSMVL